MWRSERACFTVGRVVGGSNHHWHLVSAPSDALAKAAKMHTRNVRCRWEAGTVKYTTSHPLSSHAEAKKIKLTALLLFLIILTFSKLTD